MSSNRHASLSELSSSLDLSGKEFDPRRPGVNGGVWRGVGVRFVLLDFLVQGARCSDRPTGLPDPLEQALAGKPVFDGRLSVREIQRGWDLKAELVTLSACETALGREQGGEGFLGFTQALLMSGTRRVSLSLWKVDDTATALLMQRFYANLLGRRAGLAAPLPTARALREAKAWLRGLRRTDVLPLTAELSGGVDRGKNAKGRSPSGTSRGIPPGGGGDHPFESPHFWAAFVLAGDPD